MQPRTRNIILRVLVAPVIPIAGAVLAELLWVGTIMTLVASKDIEGYLYLAGAFVLAAICAAAIKFVFNLRLRFWLVLLLVFLAVIGIIAYVAATNFA